MRQLAEAWKDQETDYSFGGDCNAAFHAVMFAGRFSKRCRDSNELLRFNGQI
jgi:hypothetical protein